MATFWSATNNNIRFDFLSVKVKNQKYLNGLNISIWKSERKRKDWKLESSPAEFASGTERMECGAVNETD